MVSYETFIFFLNKKTTIIKGGVLFEKNIKINNN